MRRTESPEAFPHELKVAPFVWDAIEDGPLPISPGAPAIVYLRGELPAGSIVVGGFIHVTQVVPLPTKTLSLYFGSVPVFHSNPGTEMATGWHPLIAGSFGQPGLNFLVNTTFASRCRVDIGGGAVDQGQFCLYLFYIGNELGAYGQIEDPDTPQISLAQELFPKWTGPRSIPAPAGAEPKTVGLDPAASPVSLEPPEPPPVYKRWSPFQEPEDA